MIKPKVCPFCGHIPVVLPTAKDVELKREGSGYGKVQCINENCPAKPFVFDGEDIIDNRGSEVYKEAAIKIWNKRYD